MLKVISTPIVLEEEASEYSLKFSETAIKQAALRSIAPQDIVDAVQGFLAVPGPLVMIGQPQWWHLTPLLRQKAKSLSHPSSQTLGGLLREYEYYLVMVGCAFLSDIEKPVKSARLTVYLRPQIGKKNPTVLDIFPVKIFGSTKINTLTRVDVVNTLKFCETDAFIDDILLTIEFKSLAGKIIGDMTLESAPFWEYMTQEQDGLLDSRFGYMIVQKPRLAKSILLKIDLTANVMTSLGLLSAEIREKDRASLVHAVCTEWIEV